MQKRYLVPVAASLIAATLGLLGCAESQPEAYPNREACTAFEETYASFLAEARGGAGSRSVEAWRTSIADHAANLDSIALSAEGDVKERISATVDTIPNPPYTIILSSEREAYKQFAEEAQRVSRACDAAGQPISVEKLSFMW